MENVGDRPGDEVVQLYVTHLQASVPVPRLHLEGFQRVPLKPGERRLVTFTLQPEQLAAYDDQGEPLVEPGAYRISVVGGQPSDPAAGAIQTGLVIR